MERSSEENLLKPSKIVPPRNKWTEIFATVDTTAESEFEDCDITLNDGEED